jgi:hypothetical protein
MVESVSGPIRAGEQRPFGIPVELDYAARSRVPEEDPETASPTSSVPSLYFAKSQGVSVESNGPAKVRYPDADLLELHPPIQNPLLLSPSE